LYANLVKGRTAGMSSSLIIGVLGTAPATKGLPHFSQNLALSVLSVPHLLQIIIEHHVLEHRTATLLSLRPAFHIILNGLSQKNL
jgi:hypothetical protein